MQTNSGIPRQVAGATGPWRYLQRGAALSQRGSKKGKIHGYWPKKVKFTVNDKKVVEHFSVRSTLKELEKGKIWVND